jgi:NAD(P)-dependent dehydrogenase (short-subunit alcohol dehydrogenase family)
LQATSLNFNDMDFQKTKYSAVLAYSRSKLYNNLFTHALAQKIPVNKGIVVSLHPGVVRTRLTRYSSLDTIIKVLYPLYAIFTKSPKKGAQTALSLVYLPP